MQSVSNLELPPPSNFTRLSYQNDGLSPQWIGTACRQVRCNTCLACQACCTPSSLWEALFLSRVFCLRMLASSQLLPSQHPLTPSLRAHELSSPWMAPALSLVQRRLRFYLHLRLRESAPALPTSESRFLAEHFLWPFRATHRLGHRHQLHWIRHRAGR